MKTTKIVLALTVFGSVMAATSVQAGNVKVTAVDHSIASQLCATAANGTKVAVFKEMTDSGWSNNFIKTNIMCNGENIGHFAARYGSDGVKQLLPVMTNVEIIELSQRKDVQGNVSFSK